jgi:uncharacterized protein YdiU (UPF0061 family)
MIGGFVHGVLNTDNINISGELFDYGPYRFLPYYDPSFTAAYFDQQGLYCYGRQPASFVWALNQLGLCLKEAYPELDVDKILSSFSEKFNSSLHEVFLNRLNLKVRSPEEVSRLISAFFKMLQETNVHFEQAFFDFYGGRVLSHEKTRNYETTGKLFLEELKKFEIKDATKAAHPYFKEEIPVTLLIDEIETLWKPIAQNDDWSFYEEKLRKIREIRGLF